MDEIVHQNLQENTLTWRTWNCQGILRIPRKSGNSQGILKQVREFSL